MINATLFVFLLLIMFIISNNGPYEYGADCKTIQIDSETPYTYSYNIAQAVNMWST